jgi:hypothetical protein
MKGEKITEGEGVWVIQIDKGEPLFMDLTHAKI